MSFLNWFSGKSKPSIALTDKDSGPLFRDSSARSRATRDNPVLSPPDKPAADSGNRGEERKIKRHARREQLYQAVREAFTHAGVLSATYRFKVLSLDQAGNEFLVMVDVEQSFDHRAEKLADIEAKIVQTAKTHCEICVTSVYWRVSTSAAVPSIKAAPPRPIQPAAVQTPEAVSPAAKKPSNFRYDPIQDDEVVAFKQALVAASANSPVSTDAVGKARSKPRSYTLLTGFEDTEMHESASTPVLSATQYGELN